MNKIGQISFVFGIVIGACGTGIAIYNAFTNTGMSAMEYTLVFLVYGCLPIIVGYIARGLLAQSWGMSTHSTR